MTNFASLLFATFIAATSAIHLRQDANLLGQSENSCGNKISALENAMNRYPGEAEAFL